MKTMLRHSLLAAAVLLCLWTPAIADTTASTPSATTSPASTAGSDVNAKDSNGDTVLMAAAAEGNIDRVKALIAAGANVNAQDNNTLTALMAAALKGHLDCLKALIAAGADVNEKTNPGATALMVAALFDQMDCVKALIAAGADVNGKIKNGNTALMAAAQDGSMDRVKGLISFGADVNVKNNDGDTALMAAARNGHADCVKALLAAGADVHARDKDGKTAADQASAYADIVAALKIAEGTTAAPTPATPTPQSNNDDDQAKKDLVLIQAINTRMYQAAQYAEDNKDKDKDQQVVLGLGLMQAFGYKAGAVIRLGDLNILLKGFGFMVQCVEDKYVTLEQNMPITEAEKIRELFHKTFSEKEILLLECEVMSEKGPDASARDRLLDDAGYKEDKSPSAAPSGEKVTDMPKLLSSPEVIIKDAGENEFQGTISVSAAEADSRSVKFNIDVTSNSNAGLSTDGFDIFYPGIKFTFVGCSCIPANGTKYIADNHVSITAGAGGGMALVDGQLVSTGPMMVSGTVSIALTPDANVIEFTSATDPLVFLLTKNGYQYISGTGTVKLPDGKIYKFAEPNGADVKARDGANQPTSER